MPSSSVRRQLDVLLALAVLPATAMLVAALVLGADGLAATLPVLRSPFAGPILTLILACLWGAALWQARRIAAMIVRGGLPPGCPTTRQLQALQHQANHDDLTGLANRRRFEAELRQRSEGCDRAGAGITLLYIDIDGFKGVNDEHGHAVGDQLLRLFAARLKAGLRNTEVVARLGGDEFAVILWQASAQEAVHIADGLIGRLSRPYRLGERTLRISASIGLAASPEAGTSGPALLAAADAAMYQAKQAGKCRHVSAGVSPPASAACAAGAVDR